MSLRATIYGKKKSTNISTTNLVSYYRFNNDTLDNFTNTYSGTPTGVSYSVGKSGQAVSFSGGTSTITLPTTILPVSDDYSITFFCKMVDTLTQYRLTEYNSSTPNLPFISIILNNTIANRLSVWVGNPNVIVEYQLPDSTQWNHIGVVINKTNGVKLFVNGYLVATNTSSITFAPTTAPMSNRIGSARNGGFNSKGLIDGYGLWKGYLKDVDILNIFNKQNSGLELV